MSDSFTYARRGRSIRGVLTVALVWVALLGLWLGVNAHPMLIGILVLFTLPACWDIVTDPPSGLSLTDDTLSWHTGRRSAEVPLSDIADVRMNTRLDFSVKVTLRLRTGIKVVLPFEATPPDEALEHALVARGLKVHRTHFQLLQ